ncbi:MAG: hypothetical protein ACOYLQ_19420 [Hyphomicrobiaceae bacterium]
MLRYVSLYADDRGESHFDLHDVPMTMKEFAPPAAPLAVSDPQAASSFVLIQLPVAWGGDEPHPSPSRQMLYCLSGSFMVTASDGDARSFQAGDALLLEDTNGKGHVTEVTSSTPVNCVMILLS